MSDISQEDLKKEIQEILKDADLDNTSAKKVRLQLEEKLDCDLTERKKEVDSLVMEVIDEQTQEDEQEEADESEDEEEEEEDEESEDERPKKKAPARGKKAASESGSEFELPSDGGGSDYEPDEPVRIPKSKKRGAPASKRKKYGSDDESSGDEWGKKKKPAAGKKKRRKADSDDDDDDEPKKPRKKRTGGNGYTKPVKLSEDLANIVGGDEMPRHEVVKRMWAYIKENNLQDPKNRQMIKCDEKLQKIIPTKKFRGFGMAKFLKDHMNAD